MTKTARGFFQNLTFYWQLKPTFRCYISKWKYILSFEDREPVVHTMASSKLDYFNALYFGCKSNHFLSLANISDLICLHHFNRSLRLNDQLNPMIHQSCLKCKSDWAFFVAAPRLSNDLPLSVKLVSLKVCQRLTCFFGIWGCFINWFCMCLLLFAMFKFVFNLFYISSILFLCTVLWFHFFCVETAL